MARHHHRTVIRREHPARARLLRLLFGLALVAALAGAYYWGHRTGSVRLAPFSDGSEVLHSRIAELETRAELDQEALKQLTRDLANSRSIIDELEGELTFYREVMAPEESRGGVVLRVPRFLATADPGRWRYELVVQQGKPTESRHVGELKVRLVGQALGQPVVLDLPDLDDNLAGEPLPLNFRYFQRFEGELYLPPEFVPERVEVDIVLQKPRSDGVVQAHDWSDVLVYTSEPTIQQ